MRDNGQVVIILSLPCCAAKRSMGDFYVAPHDTALFAELLIIEAVRDIVCKLFRLRLYYYTINLFFPPGELICLAIVPVLC